MSRDMQISEMGLKLIKAYEGYRPVDRELVSGQRVIGYGHRLYSDDPMIMDREEAEIMLRDDLAPFEDMLNENVHASLSQSQFDALCSLAYNIGPKAFLQSDTLRALNNGRPLDAANGFDVWRKSEIDGKIYVVDALMRRRTAEKALFLRTYTGKALPASTADLPPVEDKAVALLSTEDALPVFSQNDANGLVASAPYSKNPDDSVLKRRREDGPSGAMSYSEMPWVEGEREYESALELGPNEEIKTDNLDMAEDVQPDDASARASTLIAQTASELSEKLDSLIDKANGDDHPARDSDWPESLIKAGASEPDNETEIKGAEIVPFGATEPKLIESENNLQDKKVDLIIDNLAEDDALREGADSAAKYIKITDPDDETRGGGLGYWLTLLLGSALFGASLVALLRASENWLGGWGALLSFAGLITGGVFVLAALFYAIKSSLTRD